MMPDDTDFSFFVLFRFVLRLMVWAHMLSHHHLPAFRRNEQNHFGPVRVPARCYLSCFLIYQNSQRVMTKATKSTNMYA